MVDVFVDGPSVGDEAELVGAVEALGGEVLVVRCPGLATELADEVGEWSARLVVRGWLKHEINTNTNVNSNSTSTPATAHPSRQ